MTAAPSKKILVVDDNAASRYATSRVLRSAGFAVDEAATGNEAIAAAIGADLVVLDINLPDIDGFEVCRNIRANTSTARVPVVYLSASFVQEQDKVRGLNFGADGYLTHPVEAPVLVATVNSFLRARQAEDAMRESEAKFRSIFDQIPCGIALVSEDFVYLEVNPALCRILGRSRENIVGKHNSAFMPLGREGQFLSIAEQLQSSGTWNGSSTLVRSDAAHVEVDWAISPFSISGIHLAVATDVTDRRRIEIERERLFASERTARAEAERANRLKDEFVATLSHELRTPLNAIVGWTEILRRRQQSPVDLEEGLESIDRNARVQTQLIADLLDMSRITTGKLRLDLRRIDASSVVNEALSAVSPAADAKGIKLNRELTPGPKIVADPNRIHQIVWNLVNNAVKFTPRAGTITVAVKYSEGSVELIVKDTGKGIPADFLPLLFDRFSQADSTAKRTHGGLGIGLAIVKNLVEMHGGTVQAMSEGLGRGAQFTVCLPLMQPEPAMPSPIPSVIVEGKAPASMTPDALSLNGIRVLVVDDDADARKVLTRMLADFDATVADAGDVAMALETLLSFKPHILVSDLGMPGQDGYDLIRELRKRADEFAQLPAIALTAFSGEDHSRRSIRAGFQSHMAKPVNPGMLIVEIEKLAGRSRMA